MIGRIHYFFIIFRDCVLFPKITIFVYIEYMKWCMNESLEILVTRLADGDKNAYSRIFYEFYTPLLLYSSKYTGNREASEDIVQDFFCRLWENRKKLVRDKSFLAYIFYSVRNRSLNYLRDTRSVSIEGFEKQSEEDFLSEIMEEEVYKEVYAAVQKLPDRCRQIFLLKLDGKENHEIAALLQISEETVRSQLRRGRELLQNDVSCLFAVVLICYWCRF